MDEPRDDILWTPKRESDRLHSINANLEAKIGRLRDALKDGAILSGKGLKALEKIASVDFMIKACAGQLSPVDIAESVNGIIIDAKNKAQQTLKEQ